MPINMQIEYPKRVAEITTLTYEKEALQEENKVLKASNRQLVDALKSVIEWIDIYGLWIIEPVIDKEANGDIDKAKAILNRIDNK